MKKDQEVIDFQIANTESESSWSKFFESLKEPELKDVYLVTSDNHKGILSLKRRYDCQDTLYEMPLFHDILTMSLSWYVFRLQGGAPRLTCDV